MFIGVIAIIMIVVSFMNFDPKVETWSSFIGGAAMLLVILVSGWRHPKAQRS